MRLNRERFAGLLVLVFLVSACASVEILNQPEPTTNDNTQNDPADQADPPAAEPEPLDISGAWDTWATEQADTCGFDPPEPYAPILIEEDASGVTVTVVDTNGSCAESARTRDGDTVTLTRSDVLDLDGAFVRVDLSIVYEFDGDRFSGILTQSFTDLSNVFTDLPCEVTYAITGSRCNGCWTGCSATQDAPIAPWTFGLEPSSARFVLDRS